MFLEDFLSLPVGTRVVADIQVSTRLPGVVASLNDGSNFIRWDDGYATIPLGKVRKYDEYIAARVELQPTHGNAHRTRQRTT